MSRGEPTEETGLLADRSDRGEPWPTSDLPFGGEVAVGAVAILFAGAGGLSLVAGGDAPLVTLLFDAFMQVGLALGAVLGAVVLHREFDEPRLRWFVTAWYAGGILLLNVLYTWANLSALLTGTTTVVALTDGYVLFGNLGGVLGLVAGFNRGRAAQNRRLVRELEARNDTLELVNHMLRHDVLNGTQTIQGYVDLLSEDLDLDAENERYLRNIRQGGTRITNLVEDVRVVMDTITEGVTGRPSTSRNSSPRRWPTPATGSRGRPSRRTSSRASRWSRTRRSGPSSRTSSGTPSSTTTPRRPSWRWRCPTAITGRASGSPTTVPGSPTDSPSRRSARADRGRATGDWASVSTWSRYSPRRSTVRSPSMTTTPAGRS